MAQPRHGESVQPRKSKAKKKTNGETDGVEQSFVAALKAAAGSPNSDDAWDHVEELADALQRPDEVAALYREVLDSKLAPKQRTKLSKRAVNFTEEWFGDNPGAMEELLGRIIDSDSAAQWAFERLTVALTVGERWDDLLAHYDRVLGITTDKARRKQLLNDAAQVAKDFAEQPGRAVDYLQMLLQLDPKNAKLAASIERLLERQKRWVDLIELWQGRIPTMKSDDARTARVRIAGVYLDNVGDHARALGEIKTLVDEVVGHREACELLERILADDHAPKDVRWSSLGLLRTNYEAAERKEEVVRALERTLQFAEPSERLALYREAGTRLAILRQDEPAMEHYASLLKQEPVDADARKQLRQLARRAGLEQIRARALVDAAAAADDGVQQTVLLLDAAQIQQDQLGDTEAAIELYTKVLALSDSDATMALQAAHSLDELLGQAGRAGERLAVLERIAQLERAAAVRRSVLGSAGRLAQELGDLDRALGAWRARLETDATDREANDAVVDLLRGAQRWDDLVQALQRRADGPILAGQRRIDLVDIATTQADELDRVDDAIGTWLQIREEFGDTPDTIAALDDLMTRAERWEDLNNILESAAGTRRHGAAKLLARLGDLCRTKLERPETASMYYAQTLGVDPNDEQARTGLEALLAIPGCAHEAAEALVHSYEVTDDWQRTLDIVDIRIDAARDIRAGIRTLREAAALWEARAGDQAAALKAVTRAFLLDPADTGLEHESLRLAQATGGWDVVADAFREAAQHESGNVPRSGHLRRSEGRIREEELQDFAGAADAFAAAAALEPSLEIQRAIIRVAGKSRRWEHAGPAVVALSRDRDVLDQGSIDDLEAAAEMLGDWPSLVAGVAGALSRAELPTELGRDFELLCARWYFERLSDAEHAEEAAVRASAHDPGHRPTLDLLIRLQRTHPGPALVDTLLRVDALSDRDLDAVHEAAEVALEHTEDRERAAAVVGQLYRKATRLWARMEELPGQRNPQESASWAIDKLVSFHRGTDDRPQAIRLLLGAAQLPFSPARAAELRLQAARLAVEHGDRGRAIDLFRRALEEKPDDLETISDLAQLCEQADRLLDLIALRRRQLELVDDPAQRLELRLELARLVGELQRRGGRETALRENLAEVPGHEASIEALEAVMLDKGQYAELADVLMDQAQRLEQADELGQAATLWAKLAPLCETRLGDIDRALAAHRRVVELQATPESLDALARLHTERGQPSEAASWLEMRLDSAEPAQRVAVRLKLARARIAADLEDDAVTALEAAFEEAPKNGEVRKLLLGLYRNRGAWEPLAAALSVAAEHIADTATILAYAREAATIFNERLQTPDRAVPVLERAYALAPDDRKIKSQLAEGLRVAERLDEAKSLLTELIADFGRRRSADRAGVHLQLARVAHAQGDSDEALDQLELAAKMDTGNPTITQTLGELAREAGQLERAERAYRTLLLQVKRAGATQDGPGAAEVLIELSRIGADRGQHEQAEELVESALEAIAENDDAAPRLQEVLRARGDYDLLRRVLDGRLATVEAPRKRAEILASLADLHEEHTGQQDQALAARLEAVDHDPGSPIHHERARELAASMGQLERYIGEVETLLERARRNTDQHVRCELLLRLGEANEHHRNDIERAAELYGQAEETGVREVDVWRALARIRGAQGDQEAQMEYLRQLSELGEDQAETRADAMYRMAEVQLADDDSIPEGVRLLELALADAPRYERAARILGRATADRTDNAELLALYEQIARRSGDEQTLLQAIERRVRHADTDPDQVKEGVELALRLEQEDRAEALMLRAVQIGESLIDGSQRVAWALLSLARRRKDAGDLAGAVKWLSEAVESADATEVFAFGRELAEAAAGPDGDLTLAAKLYENLLERDPTAREAWEPLAALYRQLGDVDRLHRLVDETLDGLQDSVERNALRLELARTFLGTPGRENDAIEVLRNILLEDPEHAGAQEMLGDHLERTGNVGELIDLLRNQLMNAQGKGEPNAIADAALRLGARLESSDPAEAVATYQSAIDSAPTHLGLLRKLAEHLSAEEDPTGRAELLERLIGIEEPQQVPAYTVELAELREAAGDGDAALAALATGYQRAPTDEDLRNRLQGAYEARGDYRGLATMLRGAAEQADDPAAKVAMLTQAAGIHRDLLTEPDVAAEILGGAAELHPGDVGLTLELASTLAAAGRPDAAATQVSELLEQIQPDDPMRQRVTLMRADLRRGSGDLAGAIADLEVAMTVDPVDTAPMLADVLEQARVAAASAGDEEAQRGITVRLVDVLVEQARAEEARALLSDWVERARKDTDALHRLLALDLATENWEAVVKSCGRLVAIETGPDQVAAAVQLAQACRALGQPGDARAALEHARRKQPDNPEIRNELKQIYEETGADAELAKLLTQEAQDADDPAIVVDLWRRIAALSVAAGDTETAMEGIRKVLELAPGDPYATITLADAHTTTGDFAEADAVLDAAIAESKGRRSPELAALQHRKSRIAGARGDYEGQLTWLQQAFTCDKNNGQVAAELADLAEAMEDWDLAVRVLRTITLLDSDCPITRTLAFLRQAKIAFRRGDRQRAVLWARKARQEEPDSPDVAAFLAELGEG